MIPPIKKKCQEKTSYYVTSDSFALFHCSEGDLKLHKNQNLLGSFKSNF